MILGQGPSSPLDGGQFHEMSNNKLLLRQGINMYMSQQGKYPLPHDNMPWVTDNNM